MPGRADGVPDPYGGLLEVIDVVALDARPQADVVALDARPQADVVALDARPQAEAPSPGGSPRTSRRWRLFRQRDRLVDGRYITERVAGAATRLDVFRPATSSACPLTTPAARVPVTHEEETLWYDWPDDVPASHFRADDGSLRCPWISCAHHLWSEIAPAEHSNGSLRVNAWQYESPADMPNPCALARPQSERVVDDDDEDSYDGVELEVLEQAFRLKSERIQQIQQGAIAQIKANAYLTSDGVVRLLVVPSRRR